MNSKSTDEIKPAATVVLLRDAAEGIEILYLRRNSELAFFGGAWVFPGGRIDPQDFERSGNGDLQQAARHAAVRETAEEANIELSPEQFVLFSEWTTPPGRPRRFRTWFFLAQVGAQADSHEVEVDGGEIHDYRWMHPRAALEARGKGEVELPGPTFVTTSLLTEFATSEAALSAARQAQPMVYLPKTMDVPGGRCSLYHGDAGYDSADPSLPGVRHRLHMVEQGWWYEMP